MPNIGIAELGLIFLVLLLAVGPKRIPEVTRAAGKAWRTFQEETGKAREVLKDALDEPVKELRTAIEEPGREARSLFDEVKRDADEMATEARSTWSGVVDRPDPHARPQSPTPSLPGPPPPEPAAELSPEERLYEDT